MNRRYVRVEVVPEILASLLVTGNNLPTQCTEGLPAGAKLVRVNPVVYSACLSFVFEHSSFAEVSEGQEIPLLQLKFVRTSEPQQPLGSVRFREFF